MKPGRTWPGLTRHDATGRELIPDARTLLTGCGFALAFGWLWFPSLRDALLPGFFAGLAFRPAVFGLALCAGVLAGAFAGGRVFKSRKNATTQRRFLLSVVAAHGISPALLGLAFLIGETGAFAGITLNIFLGLAGALPGLWWTSRLLALGPQRAVTALAVAAFTALLLSLPLSRLAITPDSALCVLAAGIGLAFVFAWIWAWIWAVPPRLKQAAAESDVTPAESRKPESLLLREKSPVLALCGIAALFFGLGSLNVPVAAAGAASGLAEALAHACALALAAVLLNGLPSRNSGLLSDRNGLSPSARILAAAAGALAPLALSVFCLPLFPAAASIFFHAGAALPEAAGLALCAALYPALHKDARAAGRAEETARMAGLFLVLTPTAVNLGWLTGLELMRLPLPWAGDVGPVLPGLAIALLLGSALYREGSRKDTTGPGIDRNHTEEEPATPPSATEKPVKRKSKRSKKAAATLNAALTGDMTERERALALMLVKGHSNKDVAEALELSENTVRWYIKKLNKKTGAADRAALIAALKGDGGGA